MDEVIGSPLALLVFTVAVIGLVLLDVFAFHRKAHEVPLRAALGFSIFWLLLALAFNAWVWLIHGSEKGLEFLTGYLLEKSLSVDNLFVFLVIFSYFGVPPNLQHRVLFFGILGALVMRAAFIFAGAALIKAFHPVIYLFGAFLIFTGIRLLIEKEERKDLQKNKALRLFKGLIPLTSDYQGEAFFVRKDGKTFATPLALVLVVIEASDVVFAIDSIPAIFAVTTDTFIVYTSNIFAILGLRALYFLLAGTLRRFIYLRQGLSAILLFVGIKMCLSDLYPIPIEVSLSVVAGVLAITIGASLWKSGR